MTSRTNQELIGFLSVVEPGNGVLIGGYLILNQKGRPVEFHCTAPVQPNRAQQILYGTSLRPYLCGERIGHSLVSQSKRLPSLICTDISAAMDLRERVSTPVVLVSSQSESSELPDDEIPFMTIALGTETARIHKADDDRRTLIEKLWQPFAGVCLTEPFGRIHEAVREAHRDAAA